MPNSPVEKVQAGLAAFRAAGAELLIGLGGGSPQDTCKAISVIATNPEFEDVLSLEGLSPTKNPVSQNPARNGLIERITHKFKKYLHYT